MVSGSFLGEIDINLTKSAPMPVDSMAGRKAVWGEKLEARWMFAPRGENPMKSRGRTVGTTGVTITSKYSLIWMIRVNGGFGVRVGDRRGASALEQVV